MPKALGGQRNPLKRLVSDKEIQGNPSLGGERGAYGTRFSKLNRMSGAQASFDLSNPLVNSEARSKQITREFMELSKLGRAARLRMRASRG